MAHQRAQVEKDDGGGAMDGELPTLSISLTGVSLNCGKILAPPLPGVIRGGCKPRVELWTVGCATSSTAETGNVDLPAVLY